LPAVTGPDAGDVIRGTANDSLKLQKGFFAEKQFLGLELFHRTSSSLVRTA
jgi:hypothetical protein